MGSFFSHFLIVVGTIVDLRDASRLFQFWRLNELINRGADIWQEDKRDHFSDKMPWKFHIRRSETAVARRGQSRAASRCLRWRESDVSCRPPHFEHWPICSDLWIIKTIFKEPCPWGGAVSVRWSCLHCVIKGVRQRSQRVGRRHWWSGSLSDASIINFDFGRRGKKLFAWGSGIHTIHTIVHTNTL